MPVTGGADLAEVTLLAGLIMLVGLAGVVVPILPGLPLVLGGVALWSIARHDLTGWAVLAVVTVVIVAGSIAKYLLPGRRLRQSGVPWPTLAAGSLLGVIGFFVIPVVGLPIGFVLGVYLAECLRLHSREAAWPSTRATVKAVGWSMLIELGTALVAGVIWIVAVVIT